MTDQLNLLNVAPPLPREAATTPGRLGRSDAAHPAGRESVPPRTSDTARLRGKCVECAQWPLVDPETGLFERHQYHKSDSRNRRGKCAATGTPAETMKWAEPVR